MTANPEYLEFLVDQLQDLGPVLAKRMFGGAGLFLDGSMFGLIADDVLYLKVDEGNRSDFEALGLGPFTYKKKTREEPFQLGYFETPADVIEDADELCAWGRRACEAAWRAAAAKKNKKGKKKKGAGK